MARLTCANCGHRVGPTDVVCRACGAPLLEDGAVVSKDTPAAPIVDRQERDDVSLAPAAGPPPSQETCPHCGASIPDPQNLVCLECLQELSPSIRSAASATRPQEKDPFATTVERPTAHLRLQFPRRTIELSAGQEVSLGRETLGGQDRSPNEYDNVSRRHATVGIRPDGFAWVRDEGSTNGTYVNDQLTPAQTVTALTDGSELRLASNVRATVKVQGPTHA